MNQEEEILMIGCVEDESNVHDERRADTVADKIDGCCEQISFAEEIAEGIQIATTFLDDQILSDRHSLDTTPAPLSEVDAGGSLSQSNMSPGSTILSDDDDDDDESRQETNECNSVTDYSLSSIEPKVSVLDDNPVDDPELAQAAEDLETPAPLAELLYKVERDGLRALKISPVNGRKPWNELVKLFAAPLGSWTVRTGDIVTVHLTDGSGYAKISEMRQLDDGRVLVVYTWLYTRAEIENEFQVDGEVPRVLRQHLDQRWPIHAGYRYMLSTNRTVTLWDTAVEQAPHEVTGNLSATSIYSTTALSRQIWSIRNPKFKWMRRILELHPIHSKAVDDDINTHNTQNES